MDFKERLKDLIVEKGCSQKELAEYVGVKPNTITDWLRKGSSPKVSHIYAMVKFFNVSFDYFFTGKEAEIKYDDATKTELEMISCFRKLPQKEQYIELGRLQSISEQFDNAEKNAI